MVFQGLAIFTAHKCNPQWRLAASTDQESETCAAAQVVPEPVDKWQNVDGKGGNMLDEFYSNPQRFAYTFQNYVFVTRVMQVRASQGQALLFLWTQHRHQDVEMPVCTSSDTPRLQTPERGEAAKGAQRCKA